ncbi:MAG: Fic family protein [Bacillota bacterium]|nr:Fic family protein [Bacillota bacterium]
MERATGTYKTHNSGEIKYNSFVPASLPPTPDLVYDAELRLLVGEANFTVGMLNGVIGAIPDRSVFMAAFVRKEALISNIIEGSRATIEHVFDANADQSRNLDVEEVVNYVKAMDRAKALREELPLCSRFVRAIHAVLMSGTRGAYQQSGEFRRSQNWIGHAGATIKTASYIPPDPEDVTIAMDALERYMNTDDGTDPFVKAALIHAQFETIHPFLDGNGRVGRMLLILYLVERKVLAEPVLYLSHFLKENRAEYYQRLDAIRAKGDFEGWVKFILRATIGVASSGYRDILFLSELHSRNLQSVDAKDRDLFLLAERYPILDATFAAKRLGRPYATVNRAMLRLVEAGILKITEPSKKARTYLYSNYLDVLRFE